MMIMMGHLIRIERRGCSVGLFLRRDWLLLLRLAGWVSVLG